jgi:hypothetical protein
LEYFRHNLHQCPVIIALYTRPVLEGESCQQLVTLPTLLCTWTSSLQGQNNIGSIVGLPVFVSWMTNVKYAGNQQWIICIFLSCNIHVCTTSSHLNILKSYKYINAFLFIYYRFKNMISGFHGSSVLMVIHFWVMSLCRSRLYCQCFRSAYCLYFEGKITIPRLLLILIVYVHHFCWMIAGRMLAKPVCKLWASTVWSRKNWRQN